MRSAVLALSLGVLLAAPANAQEVGTTRNAISAFAGVLGEGYGAGASIRRMKEGRSVDFALDGGYYLFGEITGGGETVSPTVLALTGTAIWQRPGSKLSLLGGYGVYRMSFGRTIDGVSGLSLLGPHVGLGVRLSNRISTEYRIGFTNATIDGEKVPFLINPFLLRIAF